ncbi:MAG: hypothetical protein COT74_13380 [Bdellovibrionales bacterium CG10_big_fil_rev_8_21_14_0_10_45_34]|nr:MAG: hypothetical protein COT74_13380 [Bdellovibrionales bacterium CG10_big_fil_rev_8_21_14_0_10_45_34]
MTRVAAIDVGSNGIRLAIADVDGTHTSLIKAYRVGIRLGADSFESGVISADTLEMMTRAFHDFRKIISRMGVNFVRAVGTSALREAGNARQVIQRIEKECHIRIEVISGEREATLIAEAVQSSQLDLPSKCLFFDIGGGSIELTVVDEAKVVASKSIKAGTVRILQKIQTRGLGENKGIDAALGEVRHSIKSFLQPYRNSRRVIIGTGGNIECLGKLQKAFFADFDKSLLSLSSLVAIIGELERMSVLERTEKLNLRADRADVILIAARLLTLVAELSLTEQITIPYVGLKDGLIRDMALHPSKKDLLQTTHEGLIGLRERITKH